MKTLFLTAAAAAALFAAPLALSNIASPAQAKTCPQAAEALLTNASMPRKANQRDIVDVASEAGSFKTLLAAATAAGLVDALQGEGPLTVFAPTDEAFRALPAGTVERLLRPENRDELRRILSYHVVQGEVFAADLAGRTLRPRTLAGARLTVDGRQGVSINNARVITADVTASNGVIHVIDRVLLPPAH